MAWRDLLNRDVSSEEGVAIQRIAPHLLSHLFFNNYLGHPTIGYIVLRESDSDWFPVQWQSQSKNRASADLAIDRHAPAVKFGDLSDERQS